MGIFLPRSDQSGLTLVANKKYTLQPKERACSRAEQRKNPTEGTGKGPKAAQRAKTLDVQAPRRDPIDWAYSLIG